jgi:hypothetical protein
MQPTPAHRFKTQITLSNYFFFRIFFSKKTKINRRRTGELVPTVSAVSIGINENVCVVA